MITGPSWLSDHWEEASRSADWRRTLFRLRGLLDPPQRESLFDVDMI